MLGNRKISNSCDLPNASYQYHLHMRINKFANNPRQFPSAYATLAGYTFSATRPVAKNKWSASQIDIFLILYGEVQFKLLSRRPAGSNDPYYCPSHLSGDQRVEIQCSRPLIGQTATPTK